MGLSSLQDFLCKLQELLGDEFEHFESLNSFENHLLFWVVSCGRMTSALCLILLRITSLTFGSYGRLYRLYEETQRSSPSVRVHLRNWGMLGTVVG